jgi:N-acyl-D-amino-acid deacylase
MMTGRIARAWGFTGRGLVKSGYLADLNVIDPESVAPQLPVIDTDLPAGAVRLKQKATGIRATIVAGSVTFVDGEHTGALPGRLVRALTARGASSA